MKSSTCLDDDVVAAFVEGKLWAAERAAALDHLDTCPPCRRLVSSLAAPTSSDSEDDDASAAESMASVPWLLRAGGVAGRFIILQRLGAGGMGIVYAAHDPELDRKVALKILFGRGVAEEEGALLREAQAMARVVHPNVVTVHDVGTVGDQVFTAMEFVDGVTARQWLRQKPRTVSEILRVYVEAGHGIAAAHAAALVHRDFKPDNVLVGRDGRARVTDFGLAREAPVLTSPERHEPAVASSEAQGTAWSHTTEHTATTAGTPAYLSPEQHEGRKADARSDQFSFCVALFEALYGELPFAGTTLGERRRAVLAGDVRFPRPYAAIPRRVRRALLRGLRVNRRERHDSMAALLRDLTPPPRALRFAWLAAGLLAGGTIAAGIAAHRESAAHAAACAESETRFAGIWDAARADQVATAFANSGKPFAPAAITGVKRALDDYTRKWKAESRASCEAPRLHKTQNEEMGALRRVCFERRRGDVKALTDVFVEADSGVVERAVEAVRRLSPLATCSDVAALVAEPMPPRDPAARVQVERLRLQLGVAQALRDSGKVDPARSTAEQVLSEARTLGYAPLAAEALYLIGALHEMVGNGNDAKSALESAASEAEAARHDVVAARARTLLVAVVGARLGKTALAHDLARSARSAVDRAGRPPEIEASLALAEGRVFYQEGQFDEAWRRYERAAALLEGALGADAPELLPTIHNRANVLLNQGKYRASTEMYAHAQVVAERAYGPDHPRLKLVLEAMSLALSLQGRFDDAVDAAQHALRIVERTVGRDHISAVAAMHALAAGLLGQGRVEEALTLDQQALATTQRTYGAEHYTISNALIYRARAEDAAGRTRDALQSAELGAAMELRVLGAAHPGRVDTLTMMAALHRKTEQHAKALTRAKEAVALAEKVFVAGHPSGSAALGELGRCELATGNAGAAVATLERALVEQQRSEGDPLGLADTSFALAQALVKTQGDAARARKLAHGAAAFGDRSHRQEAPWMGP